MGSEYEPAAAGIPDMDTRQQAPWAFAPDIRGQPSKSNDFQPGLISH